MYDLFTTDKLHSKRASSTGTRNKKHIKIYRETSLKITIMPVIIDQKFVRTSKKYLATNVPMDLSLINYNNIHKQAMIIWRERNERYIWLNLYR